MTEVSHRLQAGVEEQKTSERQQRQGCITDATVQLYKFIIHNICHGTNTFTFMMCIQDQWGANLLIWSGLLYHADETPHTSRDSPGPLLCKNLLMDM